MPESNELLSAGAQLIGMPLAGPESFSEQQLTYLKRALGVDETVLWSNNRSWVGNDVAPGTRTGTLSETVSNFERIRVYFARNNGTNLLSDNTSEFDTGEITTKGGIFISTIFINATNRALFSAHTFLALNGLTFTETMGSQWKQVDNSLDTSKVYLHPYKIVGIHRIQGGN